MAIRSIFNNGNSGMTRGGLDRNLGPEARDYSSMPEVIENPTESTESPDLMKCDGSNADQPVCQIAKAEAEIELQKMTEKSK